MPPDPQRTVVRFGRFELVHACRELRLDGEPQPMQPLVFGLLCTLVRHRDRVVSKDELLDELWPDTFVTESSLQKAMSVLRSALRNGDAEDAIKTLPRQGYRFVADVEETSEPGAERFPAGQEESDLARELQDRATAGDSPAAARTAVRLAMLALDRIEVIVARGWVLRAERLLGEPARTREWGLLHAAHARVALYSGANEECLRRAELATEIGRELQDPEIETLGLCHVGHALLSSGKTREAIAAHEEAAAMAMSGALDPQVAGLVYCSVIWGSSNRGDWGRANEWTTSYSRWCERHPTAYYPGLCQLHRAEVHHYRGELEEADAEISRAAEALEHAAPWAAGEAHRVRGQILLDRGDLEGAEAEFRRSLDFGWEPQPGHAWVQFARGKREQALRGLRRAIDSPFWATAERRMFLRAEELSLALACGNLDVARNSLEEIRAARGNDESAALVAAIQRAEGEFALAQGRPDEAIELLRASRDGWLAVGSPPLAARSRIRLAEALAATGDEDSAAVERDAARDTFIPLHDLDSGA